MHAPSASFPRVSLEDIQSAPRETLIQILQLLGFSLDYIDMQLEMFADFRRCTGNNTLVVPSASSHLRQIVPLSSDFLASNASLNKDVFKEADDLMGYKV